MINLGDESCDDELDPCISICSLQSQLQDQTKTVLNVIIRARFSSIKAR